MAKYLTQALADQMNLVDSRSSTELASRKLAPKSVVQLMAALVQRITGTIYVATLLIGISKTVSAF
jgi:hypothetical protein